MDQRDLARIGHARELALGKERGAQRQAVKSTDQLSHMPGFNAVGTPSPVKGFEYLDDRIVDPGLAPVRLGFGTAAYDLIEGAVHGDVITVGANGAGKAARHMEFLQG